MPPQPTQPSAPQISKEQFTQMFNYAKQNPNAPASKVLAQQIQSGMYNQFGSLKPSPSPSSAVSETKQLNPLDTGINYMKHVADEATGALKQGGQAMQSKDEYGKPINPLAAGISGGGAASKVILSPLTTILKGATAEGVSKLSLEQQQQLAEALHKVATSPEAQFLSQAAKDHPSIAASLKGIADITGLFGAAEGIKGIKTAAEDIGSVSDAFGKVMSGKKEIAPGFLSNGIESKQGGKVVDETSSLIKEGGQVTPKSAREAAWKDIQPKDTPTTKLAYAKGGNTTEQGLLTKGKITASEADNKLLDTYERLYSDGVVNDKMSPQEKHMVVNREAAKLNNQQKDFLATHDKAVNLTSRDGSGLVDKLDNTAKKSSLPFNRDASTKAAYDSAIDTFKESLDTGKSAGTVKGATTLSKIDKALTNFNSQMEKFGAWGKTKTGEFTDTALARQQAIRDIHTTVRDFISNELPPNSPWKYIRSEESNLYSIADRLAQRVADTVGTSQAGQVIKSNPLIKPLIKGAGLGAGLHIIP